MLARTAEFSLTSLTSRVPLVTPGHSSHSSSLLLVACDCDCDEFELVVVVDLPLPPNLSGAERCLIKCVIISSTTCCGRLLVRRQASQVASPSVGLFIRLQ